MNIRAILVELIVSALILFGVGYYAYHQGEKHQIDIFAVNQTKANKIVTAKNEVLVAAPAKEAEIQIVYKDKIVTKYKTIEKEVIKYEETPAATVSLDPEFIRLHNNAASAHGEAQITESAVAIDGTVAPTGITTGQAIGVISRNYEDFYQCKLKVEGWNRFYSDVQKTVNEGQ